MVKSQDNLPQKVAQWLSMHGRKSSTCRAHKQTILRLLSKGLSPSTPEKFSNFIFEEKERGISSSHINNYITSMRIWCKYYDDNEIKREIKMKDLKMVPDKFKMKATMSDEEIESFLNIPAKVIYRVHPKTKKRFKVQVNEKQHHVWTVFFSIMAYTGMRPGEVAGLRIDDIDFGREVFVLHDTKINQPRLVPLAPNIKNLLRDYIKDRDNYLFPSRRPSGVVHNVDWHYNFHERINRLGVKRSNLTPYSLRHSLITRLLEEDVNLFKVQKIVGHSDLRTTAHYTHLTTKDTQRAIQKHPLVRKHTDPQHILKTIEEFINTLELAKDNRFEYSKSNTNKELVFKIKIN